MHLGFERFRLNGAWALNDVVGPRLRQLDAAAIGKWLARHRQPPRLLYHYTTAAGFMGIVQSDRFWATANEYCNDSSELRYGLKLIDEVLRERLSGTTDEQLRVFIERAQRSEPYDWYYVTCFCTNPDLLSQWRGYGGRGAGYALGFKGTMLGNAALAAAASDPAKAALADELVLRKVIYTEAEQREVVNDLIDAFLPVVSELIAAHGPEKVIPPACSLFRDHVREIALSLKHHAFEEEGEWRVICRHDPSHSGLDRICFRAVRDALVPYIELDLACRSGVSAGRLPLEEVVIGPGVDQTMASATRMFLRKHNYDHISLPVRFSQIPYRG